MQSKDPKNDPTTAIEQNVTFFLTGTFKFLLVTKIKFQVISPKCIATQYLPVSNQEWFEWDLFKKHCQKKNNNKKQLPLQILDKELNFS